MQISITSDFKKAQKALGRMSKQVPFAASLAMNKTAESIQSVEKRKIQSDLDRPTPAVVKSIRVQRSSKRYLNAAVFVLPAISNFLHYQVEGGTRAPRGRTEAVPVKIRLNKYGNIPARRQNKIAKLLARPDTFSGTVRGVPGIYQRGRGRMRNKKVKLLLAYENRISYRPRFPFYRYAQTTLNRVWRRQFNNAIARALRSAR